LIYVPKPETNIQHFGRRGVALVLIAVAFSLVLFFGGASAEEESTCARCGKAIDRGRWIEAEGQKFHGHCFRCESCREPIYNAVYQVHQGKFYDTSCYYELFGVRCHASGEIIKGKFSFNELGDTVRAELADELENCLYCGRWITEFGSNGGHTLSGDRRICGLCFPDLLTEDDARALMDTVRMQMEELGIQIKPKEIPLNVVDRERLLYLSKGLSVDPWGLAWFEQTSYQFGLFKDREYRIYLLDSLPRTQARATLAHELMHVYLYSNGRHDMDPALAEGSCDAVSWMILRSDTSAAAARLMEGMERDKHPLYGEGFRRSRSMYLKRGMDAWLRYLRKNDKAPW